jgi:hypothetical protein
VEIGNIVVTMKEFTLATVPEEAVASAKLDSPHDFDLHFQEISKPDSLHLPKIILPKIILHQADGY